MLDSLHPSASNRDLQMSSPRILNSWKEIAAYLGRGVRTTQRYEEKLALPVHRPSGKDRSSVLAFSDEVERWLRSAPTRKGKPPNSPNGNSLLRAADESASKREPSDLERAKQEMERCYAAYVRARERYHAAKTLNCSQDNFVQQKRA